jgi:hydrophobe/amphiphile efflux-3 (HAE3) family protein
MIVSKTPRISFQSYLSLIIKHPVWALSVIAVVTLIFAWHLPTLSFKTTVYDLIIEELPEAKRYRDFHDLFGSDEIIRMVIKADNIFDPPTFAKVTLLSEAVLQIEGVRRVISLPEVKKSIDPRSEWPIDKFAAMLAPVDLFQRNIISQDRQTTIITMVLTHDADRVAVIAAARNLIQQNGKDLQLYQIGIPLVSEALAQYTQQDFFNLTPITLGIIAVLLLVLFRNIHCLILPLACVSLSVIWTFGFMAYKGIAVSMLTIIVPVFLIAVGTAYCLHICSEYLTQAQKAPSAKIAVQTTFAQMSFPVTLAVLTTIFGIGSLVTNRITAIKEFAGFACFGIAGLLVIVLLFFPAVLSTIALPKDKSKDKSAGLDRWIDQLLLRIVALNLNYQKPCLLVIGAIVLICVGGLFFIRVETNPVSFFKESTAVSRNFHNIYQHMSGSFPMHVVMSGPTEDYFEDPSNVKELARFQTFLMSIEDVDKTVSFADYLKLVNYTYNRFDAEYYALPEDQYEMRMLVNNFKILLGNDLLKGFMSSDMRQANILMLTHITSSRQFINTKKAILDHVAVDLDRELTWQVTGLGMVTAASSHLLTIGQVKSLSISLVLIFSVMVALFLSAKVGLIAIVPNLFPILVNFGIMGLFGIPLSVATSLIASIAIGLAVDDTIHYLVRYNSEFKKDLDKDRAMRTTLMAVGRPIIFTSLTIGIGFSVLLFSHFQPTAIFGFLMVITMICALVGDLILLPTLMMHVELVTAWDLLKMMPTMGGITPGMMHELNQPLNAVKVGNDVLKMLIKKGDLQQQQLKAVTHEMGKQIHRASLMIERFSKAGNLPGVEKRALQLNEPIRSTVDLLKHQLKLDNIDVVVELTEELPLVMAHHNRLIQVIYNVMINAKEAIDTKRTADGILEAHGIALRSYHDGNLVYISICDTGTGLPEHMLDRVFEPFFTTKAKGLGKGLGLTICKQIVRDCKGRIKITSLKSGGAMVTLAFPMIREQR